MQVCNNNFKICIRTALTTWQLMGWHFEVKQSCKILPSNNICMSCGVTCLELLKQDSLSTRKVQASPTKDRQVCCKHKVYVICVRWTFYCRYLLYTNTQLGYLYHLNQLSKCRQNQRPHSNVVVKDFGGMFIIYCMKTCTHLLYYIYVLTE